MEQKDGATSEIAYAYDGMGRRIEEGATHIYFTAAWQVIEERNASGQMTTQNVWSPVYVDALIAQDTDSDGDGVIDGRVYALQDANWNVTALVDTSGDVVTSFIYDAYGKRSALDDNGNPTTSSFQYGHQGGRIDAVTGRINFRSRDYDTDLMRWVQQDYKAGYVDGMNLYQYEASSPGNWVDPSGLEKKIVRTYQIRSLWDYYDEDVQNGIHKPGIAERVAVFIARPFLPRSEPDTVVVYDDGSKEMFLGGGPSSGDLAGQGIAIAAFTGLPKSCPVRSARTTGLRAAESWGRPGTLADHFARHGADFGATSAEEYAQQASRFFQESQLRGLPTKVGPDGVIRVYDPATNTFGAYNANGTTATFFKPTNGLDYWTTQPGNVRWEP